MAVYATFLTNTFGYRLKRSTDRKVKRQVRLQYAQTLMKKLKIGVKVVDAHKIPPKGQFVLVSNHRSIIDPLIIEIAFKESEIFGHWISKKELYNSFFFGMFTRNAGTILLDREAKQMSGFFKDIKTEVGRGDSIFIFPEGTRNKTGTPLAGFKEGANLIALKNRLPILPVYIKDNADEALKKVLKNKKNSYEVEIKIGDIIDYKDRSRPLEARYREMFDLGASGDAS
jgi:1-acyl-sn-glycerol-3-phosphate acyltransferase